MDTIGIIICSFAIGLGIMASAVSIDAIVYSLKVCRLRVDPFMISILIIALVSAITLTVLMAMMIVTVIPWQALTALLSALTVAGIAAGRALMYSCTHSRR